MKRQNITFENLQNNETQIEQIKYAGFDLIVLSPNGEEFIVENGLTEFVTSRAELTLVNGTKLDYKKIIKQLVEDDESIRTLDINFVGNSENSENPEGEGSGVQEGVLDEIRLALSEFIDTNNEDTSEQSPEGEESPEAKQSAEVEQPENEAIENLKKALADAKERELEEQSENENKSKAKEQQEQAEKQNTHVEEMKNELRVEKVEPNENTSKMTGEYETPPSPDFSSNNAGRFSTEGEPKEEEKYEFSVKLSGKSDSGKKGDFITNYAEPVFEGTGTPASIVTIKINGETYTSTVDVQGNWVMAPIPELEEGEYKYTVTDNAGNKVSGSLVVDQTNTLTYDLSNDSGVSDSDYITNNTKVVFVGKTDPGSKVTIVVDGKEFETTANAEGDYTLKASEAISEGVHVFEIKSEDIAGNIVTHDGTVQIDTKVEATIKLDNKQDSGSKNDDEITNFNSDLTLVGFIEKGAVASLTINGVKYPVQIQDDGSWSITVSGTLPDAEYPYQLEVTDKAGNTAIIGDTIVVDTVTSLTGGLDKSSDSGESNTDRITFETKPFFSGTGEQNGLIELEINGKSYNTKVGLDGKWKLQVTEELPQKEHAYTITITDIAGNKESTSNKITVDTGVSVDVELKTDTGSSSSDGITKEQINTIAGKTESGASATITFKELNDGQPIALEVKKDGSFEYETPKLEQGTYTYKVVVKDKAGNTKSVEKTIVIDTETSVNAWLSHASDSGAESTDEVTNIKKPSIDGTGESGSSIVLTINGKEFFTTVKEDGSWSIQLDQELPEGVNPYTVKATDIAGNSKQISKSFVVDTTKPEDLSIKLDNDSGSSSTDWISKEGRLKLSGTSEPGTVLSLSINDVAYSTANSLQVNSDGTWSLDLQDTLEDGDYEIVLRSEDLAGNVSVAKEVVTVDSTTFITGGLDNSDDTGSSNIDNVTSVNTPTYSGTAEAEAEVKLYIGSKTYSTTADSDGNWSITLDTLPDGVYQVRYESTDTAGNTASKSEPLKIDTIDPVKPTIQLANDSGESGRDFISKNNIPDLKGKIEPQTSIILNITLENGDSFSYKEPEINLDADSGEWSFTSPIKFPDGTHKIEVVSVDSAGNKARSNQSIEIDTSIQFTQELELASDSGLKGDKVTNVTNPVFKGTGIAGDSITIKIAGNSYTTTVSQEGTWSIKIDQALEHRPDSPYVFEVIATDVAGNAISKSNSITIDTKTDVSGGLDSTSDSLALDTITTVNKPLFSGRGEVGARIELTIDSKLFSTTVDESGRWEIQIETALSDRKYDIQIESTDISGNSKVINREVTIDTSTSLSGGLDIASDSASKDSITKFNKPYFSGHAEKGSKVTVTIGGRNYEVKVGDDGTWKVQISDPLSDEDHTYQISSMDVAGNIAVLPEKSVTIDTKTFVDGGLSSGFDTGTSDTDKITKFSSPRFSGQGEAGGQISLSIDGKQYSTEVSESGQWFIDNIQTLSDKTYKYTVTITDVAGNTDSFEETVSVDTTAPTFTAAKLENDTGSKNNDMITNDGNLVFIGKVESPETRIELSIDGKVYRTPSEILVAPDGSWSLDLGYDFPENLDGYQFSIKYIDIAGNEASQPGTVIVDKTNFLTGDLDISSDSGIKGDDVTNETKPVFSGKSGENSTITLFIDGQTYTTKADRNGDWSIQCAHNLQHGVIKYTIVSEDIAGNRIPIDKQIEIDTRPSGLKNATLVNDSNIEGDWVTKNPAPKWKGSFEPGTDLTITIVGSDSTTTLRTPEDITIDELGNWSSDFTGTLDDGQYTVSFSATDKAGNKSYYEQSLVIDTVIDISGSLDKNSDTGSSNSDLYTSRTKPVFTGKGEPGATVTLTIDGVALTTKINEDKKWSITIPEALSDNRYLVAITVEDLAGNSKSLPEFEIVIDTTKPDISSIALKSDTGESASDKLTNTANPVLAGNVEPGSFVTIEIDDKLFDIPSSSIGEDGYFEFTLPETLLDGTYEWSVSSTDLAGNTSVKKDTLTIDTSIEVEGGLDKDSDSGESNTDGVTNNRTPDISGKTDANAKVTVRFEDGTEYTTTANSRGVWNLTVTSELSNGRHHYEIISTDKAGNSKSIDKHIDVDFLKPSVSISLSNDTGASNSDGITKSRTPIFQGTSERGSKIEVIIDNTTYSEPTVKVGSDGAWSLVLPVELDDGPYLATVLATDLAGNKTSKDLPIEIDNSVTLSGELKSSSDSGKSDSDAITNIETPTYLGNGDEDSKVVLKVNDNTYATTVDADGRWEVQITDKLPQGTHNVSIEITDKAGNTKTVPRTITIDTESKGSGRIDSASDSGESQSDNITKFNKPLFKGLSESGSTVTVKVNGTSQTVEAESDGSWELRWETQIPDGTHKVTYEYVDVAGNKHTHNHNVTIDTTKPSIPEVSLTNDSGSNKNDGVTNQNRPEFAGRVNADERVALIIDGRTFSSPDDITVDPDGNWSFRAPFNLDDDTFKYQVVVTDMAGNSNQIEKNITIDTKYKLTLELDSESDSGLKGDFVTKSVRPTLKGKSEAGSKLTIILDDESHEIEADENGTWEFTPSKDLVHGEHKFEVHGVDKAGNKDSKTETLFIDTSTLLTGGLTDKYNSGSKSDLITNSEVIEFSGNGEAGSKLQITINSNTYESSVDEYNRWSFEIPETLPEGIFKFEIISTDKAGNVDKISDTIEIDRTNFLNVELSSTSDSGVENNDGITNVKTPTFIGSSQAGSKITLVIDSTTTYNVPLNDDGSFEFKIPTQLLDKEYNYTFTSTDKAGNLVEKSGSFVVDTVAELTGGLDSDSDSGVKGDNLTRTNTPKISGTSEPGAVVSVEIDDKKFETTVGGNGEWSIQIPDSSPLEDSPYQYTISVVDLAGNPKSLNRSLVIDTKISFEARMTSDSGVDSTDGITQETRPQIEGTIEIGAKLVIKLNDITYRSGVDFDVQEDGSWTFTPPAIHALDDGIYNWSASAIDNAGNKKVISGVVTVDTTQPTDLTVELKNGSVDDLTISKNATPIFGGNYEVGTAVSVKVNGKTQPQSSITQNEYGSWEFTSPSQLEDGIHKFEFTSTDKAGNEQKFEYDLEIDTSTTLEGRLSEICDTGESSSDRITNSKNIMFDGKGEAGSLITVTIDGRDFETTVKQDNTWEVVIGELDGSTQTEYQYTINTVDKAGNTKSLNDSITVDTSKPINPIFSLKEESNSADKSDWHTKERSIVLEGVAEAGTELVITVGGDKYEQQVDATGQWTLDLGEYAEGTHPITVTSTDKAGNSSVHNETLVIDRSLQLTGGLDKGSDTGVSNSDFYTSNTKPVFSGTTDPNARVTVTISVAGGSDIILDALADSNGKWVTDPSQFPNHLASGTYEYAIEASDQSGNTKKIEHSITVDDEITLSLRLDASTNSGSKSDTLTNIEKPRFSGNGQPDDDITIEIRNEDGDLVEQLNTTVTSNGLWVADVQNDLPDGHYSVLATSVDKAGNTIDKSLDIEIDTQAPIGLIGGLDDNSNTGDKSDTITKENVLKFSGKVEIGCKVDVVFENGDSHSAIVQADGTWYLQMTEALVDGVHNYSVIATDRAGNPAKIDRSVTVDRTIKFTGKLDAASDTGWFDNDFVTFNTKPIFEGHTDPFSTVVARLNTNPPKTITVKADSDGKYSLALGDLFGLGAALPQGSHSLTFTATDPAGNPHSFNKNLVIDTQKPSGLTLELADTSDSNIKGDFITSNNTPVIKGHSEAKDVRLKVTIAGNTHDVTINPDGTWSFAVPELDDGSYPLVVTTEDLAGNVSNANETLVIDTQAPDQITGRLASTSDKGQSNSDSITNQNQNLRFSGKAEVGSKVVFVLDTTEYEATVDSKGNWAVIVPDRLDDGDYLAEVKVMDKAGNVGTQPVEFKIDTTLPDISQVKLRKADDTGESDNDAITKVTTPTITGLVSSDFAAVWITVDGTTKRFEASISEDGRWRCKLSNLGEGTFTYTVHAIDIAGNENSSSGHEITIDSKNNLEAELLSTSDSGVSNSDGITNNQKPSINIKTDIGNLVGVYVTNSSGAEVFSKTLRASSADFNVEVDKRLTDGIYSWKVISYDTAGNYIERTEDLTIDTISTVTGGLTANADTGTKGDNKTNLANPILGGKAEHSSAITIKVSGKFDGGITTKAYTAKANSNGDWTFTIPDEVVDGGYSYEIYAIDRAGNRSDTLSGGFDVDRTPPTVTGDVVTDSGSSSSDRITNGIQSGDKKGHLDFAGTTSGNAIKVVIAIGGRTYEVTPKPDGSWEFIIPTKLSDAKYTYTIYAEDDAGNRSTSVKSHITLDTKVSTTPNLSQESDSGEQGDNLTKNNKPVLKGQGEAGLQMTAKISGGGLTNFDLGAASSDSNGVWEVKIGQSIPAGLADGAYSVVFSITDRAGNKADKIYRFTVDTTPPEVILNKYNASEVTTDKPKISGSGEVGSTITLVIDDKEFSTKVGSNGQWEFESAEMESFPDGEVNYKVFATDKAGNKSEYVTDTITINTGTYIDGGLDPTTDTGILDTDSVTQNKTPIFNGNGEAGGEVTIEIKNSAGSVIRTYTTTVERNGLWEFAIPSSEPLSDGRYTYDIRIKDSTGNEAAIETKDLVIDNVVQLASIRGWSGSWGGSKHGDTWHLASTDNAIRGTLKNNESGAEVKAVINGVEYSTVTDKHGNFSITTNLPDGKYSAKIEITDVAGNTTSSNVKLDVDSVANWTVSTDDDVTGHKTNWVVATPRPEFGGTCDSDSSHRVLLQLFGDQTYSFNGQVTNGSWSLTPSSDVPDGTYSYRIIYWEKSGRHTEQRGSIIIDTVNEVMSLTNIEKSLDSTGEWSKTKIEGFAEPHATITLTIAGQEYTTTVPSSGKWSILVPVNSKGEYLFNVNSKDRAGNEVNLSEDPNNKVTIDFIDNLDVDLNENESFNPSLKPLSGTGDAGNQIKLTIIDSDGKKYVRYAAVDGDGSWVADLSTLPDGQYTVNIAASSEWDSRTETITVVIDTTPPVITSLSIKEDADGNGVISENNPSFNGVVSADSEKVVITINGVSYTSGKDFTLNPDGSFEFAYPSELPDGLNQYVIQVSDVAGNVAERKNTVDVQSTAPTITDFDLSNSVLVDGRQIATKEGSIISGAVSNNTESLVLKFGPYVFTSGKDFNIGDDGSWSFTIPSELTEGNYTLTATATNKAGLEFTLTEEIGYDVTPPSIESVTLTNDTGTIGDQITSNTKPEFSGKVEAGTRRVSLTIDNTTYTSGVDFVLSDDGHWSLSVSKTLSDGTFKYVVEATDVAGNTSTYNDELTIQNKAPEILALELDGKSLDGDQHVTNNTSPEISGIIGDETKVLKVQFGDKTFVSGIDFLVMPGGKWSIDLQSGLPEGDHKVTIIAESESGRQTVKEVDFSIDTTPPSGTGSLDNTENSFVDGDTISNSSPVFKGTGEAGATVEIKLGGKSFFTTVRNDGGWNLAIPDTLINDKYLYVIEMTDKAGNTAQIDYDLFFVDSTSSAPMSRMLAQPMMADAIPDKETPVKEVETLKGTAEFGDLIEVEVGSHTFNTSVDFDGNWSVDLTSLPPEKYEYKVTVINEEGDSSIKEQGKLIVGGTSSLENATTDMVATDEVVTLSGTADPLSTVIVESDGGQNEVKTDESGSWEINLAPSSQNISVTKTENGTTLTEQVSSVDDHHTPSSGDAPATPIAVSSFETEEIDDTLI
nr:conserved hypothetical protein [Vibrio chagasii]